MNAIGLKRFTTLFALSLSLLINGSVASVANERPDCPPNVVAVTGQSDWSILPPAIPSEYVTFHEDGRVTMRSMPLTGLFSLLGNGVNLGGTAHGILNADLDPTLSGPIYGPISVTRKVKGKDKVIFKGSFFGRVNSLLASGQILLEGKGEYAGVTIVVAFLETGANTETFVLNGHLLDRGN